ncbi:hypothetical protein EVAR_6659_1 [Eumeta japonica]|uniref:Uncharacterized protein n=1 Tax=Eumeta variegata TaxID=151549 RepID=A0A4C1TKI4_EUMVA|nr:hypothetical protein EVAR_6659_1 [Eumeta japonica]
MCRVIQSGPGLAHGRWKMTGREAPQLWGCRGVCVLDTGLQATGHGNRTDRLTLDISYAPNIHHSYRFVGLPEKLHKGESFADNVLLFEREFYEENRIVAASSARGESRESVSRPARVSPLAHYQIITMFHSADA